jgi:CRP-like cAMP-binding protein
MEMTHEQLKARFPGLTKRFAEGESSALLDVLVPVRITAGDVLVTHGARADTMCLVEEGHLSIYIEEAGERLILGQAGPGMVVGEIGMIEPGPATATVSAMSDTSLLCLSAEGFEALCTASPKAASALLECLSLDLVKRLRHASAGLLRRIDEHTWMKMEARKDSKAWLSRLAAMLIGQEGS